MQGEDTAVVAHIEVPHTVKACMGVTIIQVGSLWTGGLLLIRVEFTGLSQFLPFLIRETASFIDMDNVVDSVDNVLRFGGCFFLVVLPGSVAPFVIAAGVSFPYLARLNLPEYVVHGFSPGEDFLHLRGKVLDFLEQFAPCRTAAMLTGFYPFRVLVGAFFGVGDSLLDSCLFTVRQDGAFCEVVGFMESCVFTATL